MEKNSADYLPMEWICVVVVEGGRQEEGRVNKNSVNDSDRAEAPSLLLA